MAQNVLLKYGNTATISGETIQQGKLLIDTQKAEISIDKDGTSRVKLTPTVDSALSTTSTNPIANNAITNSIINTTAEVSAITADNIPCGTKPVKELITNLTVVTGTLAIGATSITISNARITTDSILDFYTSIYGVNPSTVTVSAGQVVLTFPAQAVAMTVGVRING